MASEAGPLWKPLRDTMATMTRGRLRALAVLLLSGALVLGGCSSADPAAPAASEAVRTGPGGQLIGRTGTFALVAPDGWSEGTGRVGSVEGVDLVVLSGEPVGGFTANLVVLTSDGDAASVATKLAEGKQELGGEGRTVTDVPDVQVDGETAKGFSTAFEQQGIEVLTRSYAVHHGGKVCLLTLSSSVAGADRAEQDLTTMLSSWEWT